MNKSRKIGPIRIRRVSHKGRAKPAWCADIPPWLGGSKRIRKFFDNCEEAERFAREVNTAYRRGKLTSTALVAGDLLFSQLVDQWLEYQALRVATGKKRQNSLDTDLFRLVSIRTHFGRMAVSAITTQDLEKYQLKRLKMPRSPETVNSDIRTMRKIFRWATTQGIIEAAPVVDLVPVPKKDEYIPEPEEVSRIISYLPRRLKLLVTLLAETGCRQGEAFNLKWDCLDMESARMLIRRTEKWTPKTQHSARAVYLSVQMVEMLSKLPRKGPYVFQSKREGAPITSIRKAFSTAVKKARIRQGRMSVGITPHTLRKAHATWQSMRGTPESVLQDRLGHSPGSPVTRKYYVRAQEREKRLAASSLSEFIDERNENGSNLATNLAAKGQINLSLICNNG